ncbi:hypothetical protein [Streptacidiphilus sp. EB103A]|uniref:hypothetical protein n=1 Tax=Streptacidiphilus sp. EB103A TaxID=3156275 RepID=UPI0035178855
MTGSSQQPPHANVADLPGWTDPADTVLGLHGQAGTHAWLRLTDSQTGANLRGIGRDITGGLYAAATVQLTSEAPFSMYVENGSWALLTGTEDGIALWIPHCSYHLIERIDPTEPSPQPDIPTWIPVTHVLKDLPDGLVRRG